MPSLECFYRETDVFLDEIELARVKQDGKEVARLAHRLLNTIACLGAAGAAETTRRLERAGNQDHWNRIAGHLEDLRSQLKDLQGILRKHRKPEKDPEPREPLCHQAQSG